METVRIYRDKGIIYEFSAEDSFTRSWGLMGDNYISITIRAKENISLLFGDYILLDDEKFILFNAIHITEANGIKEYPLIFYSEQYFANRCLVEDEGATTFSYFGGVSDHVNLIRLAFEKYGIVLSFGTIEENGSQLLNYDNTKGLDAVNKICEAFKMEWECVGGVFHIKKRIGVDTSYRFEYGKGKGAYSVGLQPIQNTPIVTRVIAKGGTINLPKDYPSTDTPKRLNLGGDVLDRNTDKYGIIPEVLINEDIYPRLIGKKVLSVDVPADIKNATVWKIKLDIPFNLADYYVPDEKPEVKFRTGDLAGEGFEIAENSWNNAEKTLQIIAKDEDGYKLPSVNRQPRTGDEFVLLNILMPENPYVTDAIKELRGWGNKQLQTVSEPQYAPSLTADPVYVKTNDIQLHPGDGIVIIAGGNEIHIRIQKITFSLIDKKQMNFELGNNIMYTYTEKIAKDLQDITDEVQSIRRNVQNVDRRGWRDAKETNERLNGIETSAALIGTEGGQLTFSGMFQANVNSNPDIFLCTEGKLQHFVYKDNPTGGIWNIGAFQITLSEDVLYNIYAKCGKSNDNGIIYISKEKIDTEAEAGYYYFFLGTISSVFEQARSVTLVTGYTFITGGYLTGQVMQDAQQRLIIDMPNATITAREGARIRGRIEFQSVDGSYEEAEVVMDQKAASAAQDKINGLQIGGVNILNGSYSGKEWNGWTTHDKSTYTLSYNSPNESGYIYSAYIKIEGGRDIIVSFDSKCTENINECEFFILPDDYNYFQLLNVVYEKSANWKKNEFKFKTPETWGHGVAIVPVRLRVDFNGTNNGQEGTIWIRNVQIEYGNIGTSYSIPDKDRLEESETSALQIAEEKINGLQIGLNNWVRQDAEYESYGISTIHTNTAFKYDKPAFQSTWNGSGTLRILLKEKIKKEGDFAISFYYKTSKYTIFNVDINDCHAGYFAGSTEWKRFEGVVHVNNLLGIHGFLDIGAKGDDIVLNVSDICIVEGNKPVDWIPAPEDQEEIAKESGASAADDKINNLQFGTVNLLNHSGNFTDTIENWHDNGGGISIDENIKYNGYNTLKTVVGTGIVGDWYQIEPGQEYCYCAMLRSDIDFYGDYVHPIHLWVNTTFGVGTKYEVLQFQQSGKAFEWTLCYIVFKSTEGAHLFRPFIFFGDPTVNFNVAFLCLTKGNRPLNAWSPSISDQQNNINRGKLYLRGTGLNRWGGRLFILNEGGDQSELGRGLNLITIDRQSLQIIDNIVYDTYGSAEARQSLVDKLNSLTDAVIVTLTSYDAITENIAHSADFSNAIARCGGSGVHLYYRTPYAFVGIPGIGKGNGLEVYTSDAPDAPYAEISTTITNGIPAGINTTSSSLANQAENNAINYANELSDNKTTIKLDLTGSEYRQDNCYPVTMKIVNGKRATFEIKSDLYDGSVPSWSSHPGGFTCECSWEANACGYGTIPENRYIYSLTYSWLKEGEPCPIGKIGQMTNSSNEYIYMRGGGIYYITMTNVEHWELHSQSVTIDQQSVLITYKDDITPPVVDVDQAKKDADDAKKLAEAAANKAAEVEFLKKAFSNSSVTIANGVTIAGAMFVESAPGSGIASAGIAGYTPPGYSTYPMIFAGANGANDANNAKFRVYSDGSIYSTKGKIGGFNIGTDYLENNGLKMSAGAINYTDSIGNTASFGMGFLNLNNGYSHCTISIRNNRPATNLLPTAHFNFTSLSVDMCYKNNALIVTGKSLFKGNVEIQGNVNIHDKLNVRNLPRISNTDNYYKLIINPSTGEIGYM